MKLRGIEFEPIFCAAGARGFFGEKYLHQRLMGPLGPNFKNSTFVAKTTTLQANKGNMPMKEDGVTPKEFMPRCILPNFRYGKIALSLKMFREGCMLNAVGLSGPGAKALFEDGRWQKRNKPFFLSFMSVGKTPKERIDEFEEFVKMFAFYLPEFNAKVGLQMNESCSNVGLDLDCVVNETKTKLKIASVLGVPLMPKFNILTPIKAVREISQSLDCDAVCISNTIHWNDLPRVKIDRTKLFGSEISPLGEFGGGALSGPILLPLVVDWLTRAEDADILKPINAGGGIFSQKDLPPLLKLEVMSTFIGSVASLRPWRVKKIIRKAHELF